jgi:hypothetical protein
MSTEIQCTIDAATDIHQLHQYLQERIIIHTPPYDLMSWLARFITPVGRTVRIIIRRPNINIVDVGGIHHHVLHTAVTAFQNHRLQPIPRWSEPMYGSVAAREAMSIRNAMPTRNPVHMPGPVPETVQSTGQQCSICFETIMSDDLQCLPCAHVFHRHCLQRWFRESATCPECRLSFNHQTHR